MGFFKKQEDVEEVCDLCGEKQIFMTHMKDDTKICDHCKRERVDGFVVEWQNLTKTDLIHFDELQVADDNFHPDFEFDGFKADTKAGVFAIKHHKTLVEFKRIKKYYIKYLIEDTSDSDGSHYSTVKGAKLVMELDHPVISSIEQSLSKEKPGVLMDFVLYMFNFLAKNAYKKYNKSVLDLVQSQTGLNISRSKKG